MATVDSVGLFGVLTDSARRRLGLGENGTALKIQKLYYEIVTSNADFRQACFNRRLLDFDTTLSFAPSFNLEPSLRSALVNQMEYESYQEATDLNKETFRGAIAGRLADLFLTQFNVDNAQVTQISGVQAVFSTTKSLTLDPKVVITQAQVNEFVRGAAAQVKVQLKAQAEEPARGRAASPSSDRDDSQDNASVGGSDESLAAAQEGPARAGKDAAEPVDTPAGKGAWSKKARRAAAAATANA